MKHLRIALRMMILVLTAIVIVGAMGTAVHLINGRIFAAADNLAAGRAVADLATALERRATAARNLILRYEVTRDPAVAEAIGESIAALSTDLAALSRTNLPPKATADLPRLTEGVAGLRLRFASLAELGTKLGQGEDTGLIAAMNSAVRAVETELKQWYRLDAPLRLMENMRRSELEYLLGTNPAAEGAHRRSYNELDFMLAGLGMDAETTQRLSGLIRAYRTAFVGVSEAMGAFRTESAATVAAFDALADGFATLSGSANAAMRQAGAEQVEARGEGERLLLLMAIGLSAGFSVLALLLSLSITRPIAALERALGSLGSGRVDLVVPGTDRGDEIGRIARAAAAIRESMLALHREIQLVSGTGGNGARRLGEKGTDRGAARVRLTGIFAEMLEVLRDTGTALQQIGHGTSMVAQSTDQASVAIRQVLDGAQAQLEEIRSVGDDLGRAVEAITDVSGATQAMADIAAAMAGASEQSRQDVDRLARVAQTLVTESREVRRITSLIQEIAETTGILSVNASIEARRAGALGKGFDTVANQVRLLSQNTENAALEIRTIAETMADRAGEASEASSLVLRRVAEFAQQMATVNGHAQQVDTVVDDQHRTMSEIERRMGSIRAVAAQNAVAAEEIKETMAQLALLSEATRQSTERFVSDGSIDLRRELADA